MMALVHGASESEVGGSSSFQATDHGNRMRPCVVRIMQTEYLYNVYWLLTSLDIAEL